MNNGEQQARESEIVTLQQEIGRLRTLQSAAETIGTRVGMTRADAEQYKVRHFRIRVLTKRLAMLNREQTDTDATTMKPEHGDPR